MNNVSKFNLDGEEINVKDEIARKGFFRGLKCVCYGDSTAEKPNTYINKLINDYNCDIDNKAITGTSLVLSVDRILQEDMSLYDVMILNYGINDWQASVPLYSNYGAKVCFIESLERVINFVQSNNKIIFVILPWYCYSKNFPNGINFSLCSIDGMNDEAIELCEKKHVPYINLYTISGINETNYRTMMEDSGEIFVHGLDYVNNLVAEMLYNGVCNNGRCHKCAYSNTVPFENSAMGTNIETIEGAIGSVKYKPYNGQNISSTDAITPKSFFVGGDDNDYLTFRGLLVVNGSFQFLTHNQSGEVKSWISFTENDWAYDRGVFRFSIPLKNLKKFYFSFESIGGSSVSYILGLNMYTDNAPLEVYFDGGTKNPILSYADNVEINTNDQKPTAEFTRNGFRVTGFSMKSKTSGLVQAGTTIFKLRNNGGRTIRYPAITIIDNKSNPSAVYLFGTGMVCKDGFNEIIVPDMFVVTSMT